MATVRRSAHARTRYRCARGSGDWDRRQRGERSRSCKEQAPHRTRCPVLAPSSGETEMGRLWTDVRDDRSCRLYSPPAVRFAYSLNREGDRPRQHLFDYEEHSRPRHTQTAIFLRAAQSMKWRAGRALGASSMKSISLNTNRPLPKLWSASVSFTLSAVKIRGSPPEHGSPRDKPKQSRLLASLDDWMDPLSAIAQVRFGSGYPLCTLAMACPHSPRRQWTSLYRSIRAE